MTIGFLYSWIAPRRLFAAMFGGAALSLAIFGLASLRPDVLLPAIGGAGLFDQAAASGLMIYATRRMPVAVRAASLGLMLGLGRLVGSAGAYGGGLLVAGNVSRATCYVIFGGVMLVGAMCFSDHGASI